MAPRSPYNCVLVFDEESLSKIYRQALEHLFHELAFMGVGDIDDLFIEKIFVFKFCAVLSSFHIFISIMELVAIKLEIGAIEISKINPTISALVVLNANAGIF